MTTIKPKNSGLSMSKYVEIKCDESLYTASLLKDIADKRNMPLADVKLLMAYNVISFNQLALVTGVSESQLRNATVPSEKRSGEISSSLNICNPFPDSAKGKLFVLIDNKCLEYIKRTLK